MGSTGSPFSVHRFLLAAHRLSLVAMSKAYSSSGAKLLIAVASLVAEHGF